MNNMTEIASKITDSELEVMRILWQDNKPVPLARIKSEIAGKTKWNGDTVRTLLRRLCEKGAVSQQKREVYYYTAVVSELEYKKYSTHSLIDKLFHGSARNLVAALVENNELDEDDVDELRAMFKRVLRPASAAD